MCAICCRYRWEIDIDGNACVPWTDCFEIRFSAVYLLILYHFKITIRLCMHKTQDREMMVVVVMVLGVCLMLFIPIGILKHNALFNIQRSLCYWIGFRLNFKSSRHKWWLQLLQIMVTVANWHICFFHFQFHVAWLFPLHFVHILCSRI